MIRKTNFIRNFIGIMSLKHLEGAERIQLDCYFFVLFSEGSLCVGATLCIPQLKILWQSKHGISLYNLHLSKSTSYSRTQKLKFNIVS